METPSANVYVPRPVYNNTQQIYEAFCSLPFVGDPISSMVPADAISSLISQADADALALALAKTTAENLLSCRLPEGIPILDVFDETGFIYISDVDFGEVGEGLFVDVWVMLRNVGAGELEIDEVTLVGAEVGWFSIEGPVGPFVLDEGEFVLIKVRAYGEEQV